MLACSQELCCFLKGRLHPGGIPSWSEPALFEEVVQPIECNAQNL